MDLTIFRAYFIIFSRHKILCDVVDGTVGHMVTRRIIEWFSAGGSRFLNLSRRAVISWPAFSDSDRLRYYHQAWLRQATDVVEAGEGM